MSYFLPVSIGDTVYFDERDSLNPAMSTEARTVFKRVIYEFVHRGEVFSFSNVEPGFCGKIHRVGTQDRFIRAAYEGDTRTFEEFRKDEEDELPFRVPVLSDEAFRVFAFRDGQAIGGVFIFGIELLGTEGDLLTYRAMVAPMLEDNSLAFEFLDHVLRNDTIAMTDDNEVIRVHLQEILFPDTDIRNRCMVNNPDVMEWVQEFDASMITWSTEDNKTFLHSVKLHV